MYNCIYILDNKANPSETIPQSVYTGVSLPGPSVRARRSAALPLLRGEVLHCRCCAEKCCTAAAAKTFPQISGKLFSLFQWILLFEVSAAREDFHVNVVFLACLLTLAYDCNVTI